MSASARIERSPRGEPRREAGVPERDRADWVGVDLSDFATRQPSRALLPLLVVALVAALGVASLRIDLIRTRYALATAMETEQQLIEEQHALIVEKLQGRDPVELAVLAAERGFRPAVASLSLPDPMPSLGTRRFGLDGPGLPRVAAGPPDDERVSELEGASR